MADGVHQVGLALPGRRLQIKRVEQRALGRGNTFGSAQSQRVGLSL
jgi:hypothetical protein